MSTPQKCEYKSYQNIKWVPSEEDFKDANLEKSIIKTVFDLADVTAVTDSTSEYKYIINDYILKDFTAIYVCAEVTFSTKTINKCYLVLPEYDNSKIVGYSAYRVNSERILLKLQSETGSNAVFVNCINGVAGEDIPAQDSLPEVKAPVLFGHAKITEGETGNTTTKECFAFPVKSSFLEGIHGNLYEKGEGKACEIDNYNVGYYNQTN